MELRTASLVLYIMATICISVSGKFYRESVHKCTDLFGDDVTVDVISEIPGNLKLIPTDEDVLSIIVKVSASTFEILNSTDILVTSNNQSASLVIRTSNKQEPAAVHGTGSRNPSFNGSGNYLIALLLWTTLVSLDLKSFHAVLLTIICHTFVTSSLETGEIPLSADVTIKATRHFRYKSIHLTVNNGSARVSDEIFKNAPEVICRTNQSRKGLGCDKCCHGNGVCFNNTCLCEDDYNPSENCKTTTRRDILFANPFDPRYSRTIDSNGMVFDLVSASNSKEYTQTRKSKTQSKLRTRSEDSRKNSSMFQFDELGFLKRVRREKMSFVLRKWRSTKCYISVIIKKEGLWVNNLAVNVCTYASTKNVTGDFILNALWKFKSDLMKNVQDLSNSPHVDRSKSVGRFYEIPFRFERCGYEYQNDVSIFFKVTQDTSTTISKHHLDKDDVYLHTLYRKDTHYLKIPSRTVSHKETQVKCLAADVVRQNICKHDYLLLYRFICDSITKSIAINATEQNANIGYSSVAIKLCGYLLETINSYCKSITKLNTPFSSESPCSSRYTETVDLFATENLTLVPMVLLQNGETIVKDTVVIPLKNVSIASKKEIVFSENVPEFKIMNISVIPKDPVPQDVYKVRLEYACATNETVIQMNVTGSDKYRSHVTCYGITECSCCSVHAAGAADAVIDYVSISVKDEIAGTDILREMVVIF